jgi:hypothetical protein
MPPSLDTPLTLPLNSLELLQSTYDYASPVYEQDVNYFFHYIAFGYAPGIEVIDGDIFPFISTTAGTILISPKIKKLTSFNVFASRHAVAKIKYLSEDQKEALQHILVAADFMVSIHSPKEVFYNVTLLNELVGKEFAKLRNTRNALLATNKLEVRTLTGQTLVASIALLKRWTELRGHLYPQSRLAKEVNYITFLASHPTTTHSAFVYYWQNKPIGIGVLCTSVNPQVGIIHIVKAINREEEGGHHGASDAIYLHLARIAQQRGFLELNDGDLGYELGTMEHKLRFKPLRFHSTFTIEMAH